MRVTKFARILIGITSLFVTGVYLDEVCVVLSVKPSWRLPRCSGCGRRCPGYDHRHEPVRWVHLGIGAIRLILEYTPRRVECPHCGVRVELVSWARAGSRFTRAFEEMTAYLAQITNKTEVAKMMGISWRTVGHIVERVVAEKRDPKQLDGLRRIGVDEFSYRKRHRYITTVVDHDTHRIVWAAEGKSSETLDAFFDELGEERRKAIEIVTIDMSAAFIKSCAVRRLIYRGPKKPAMPGSGQAMKGVANVAETGPAACKSRATLTVGDGAYAPETGYHRCHGKGRMSDCPYNPKSMLDPSVRRTNPSRRDMLREPGRLDLNRLGVSALDMLPPGPETERSQGSQGQSRPPKASRVSQDEHGNSDTSARQAKPGKPPGPVMSRTGGSAFVVVGARESRVHGEGR